MTEIQNDNEKAPNLYISSAGKFGIKGVKYFILTLLVSGLINTIFLIISVIKFQSAETTDKCLIGVGIVIIVGLLCTATGLYLTYKYLMTEGIKTIYQHLMPFFKRLSTFIVDKTSTIINSKVGITNQHIEKTFSVGNIIADIYGNKVPKSAQTGVAFILKRLPFIDLFNEAKDCLKDQDKEKASSLLFIQIDSYVTSSIIGDNSMRFLYWLSPLNIVLQIIAIILTLKYIIF